MCIPLSKTMGLFDVKIMQNVLLEPSNNILRNFSVTVSSTGATPNVLNVCAVLCHRLSKLFGVQSIKRVGFGKVSCYQLQGSFVLFATYCSFI